MVLDVATKDRLRQQIEFYFSDSNLPRDKFLQETVRGDPEGYVDIALLCIFSRVRALLKSSVSDPAAVKDATVADVADALEAADSLVLSDDRKRVRRAAALKGAEEGDTSGTVRFEGASQAQAALGKAEDGRMLIAGYSAAVRVLEGEEEEAFMKRRAAAQRAAAQKRKDSGGRGGRGGGRGGRGRGSGRGGRGGRGGKRGRHN
ncbi:hypothetical protein CHLNCDRAFT_135301 [Chlorella variabilis]|uniref:Uncharacterized protein n=1 Tax=Chlorella variabilis TaxID=554065 RepID=E1ZHX7_CHLVA|nr:hypothetical protein CHLNCDRAFT_135301 [Chlorella variabilis]EFN54683.1 hypothetical protein CHLNCDRAFT_135301 [Chlorella variabilis]|eukprot:XP_005846785.1 hypothetical protein CHLNCDRAFT_135301 [Chlorella variabilis]